jgi:hypothetical protein
MPPWHNTPSRPDNRSDPGCTGGIWCNFDSLAHFDGALTHYCVETALERTLP